MTASPAPSLARTESAGVRTRRLADATATVILWSAAFGVILVLACLIAYLTYRGAYAISWQFLTSVPKETESGGGVGPEIFNSFYILGLTLVMTVPIATLAGIYMQEYARPGWFRSTVQFSAESLATIPSIVMGLFGLLIFVYLLGWRFTALGGACTLTILNLPALMRVTQEALATVPDTYREASLGLGGTRWQTILKVILPSAIGPLTTGVVLISGRIFGETAALIYTSGLSVSINKPYDWNPMRTAETLSVHLWYTRSESLVPDVGRIGDGSALVLLAMVLVFNFAARIAGRILTRHLTGK